MKYKSVVITRKGGPEVLQVIEHELREPQPGQVRVRILATGVGRTDIVMRYHYYVFAPKIPFTPGYQIVGTVDAVGPGVTRFSANDRVAALTVHGGYAEYIFLGEEHLAHVPASVDLAEAASLILNYVTAYQMLHRTAQVKAGEKALITGASGGVGTALLELGKLAGLKTYGTASRSKHELLSKLGTQPIDYKTQDIVGVIRAAEPSGLDFVFDGLGSGSAIRDGFAVLRPGGRFVEYGYSGFRAFLLAQAQMQLYSWLSKGKSAAFYGITSLYRQGKRPFFEDVQALFGLLEQGKLRPTITQKLPILEAAKANELLETGKVSGQIVLLAPELL